MDIVINGNDKLLRLLKEVNQINGLSNHFLTGPLRVKKVINDNTLCLSKTRTICFMRAENVFVLCQEIGSPAERLRTKQSFIQLCC
jgi:hypothetical protein